MHINMPQFFKYFSTDVCGAHAHLHAPSIHFQFKSKSQSAIIEQADWLGVTQTARSELPKTCLLDVPVRLLLYKPLSNDSLKINFIVHKHWRSYGTKVKLGSLRILREMLVILCCSFLTLVCCFEMGVKGRRRRFPSQEEIASKKNPGTSFQVSRLFRCIANASRPCMTSCYLIVQKQCRSTVQYVASFGIKVQHNEPKAF